MTRRPPAELSLAPEARRPGLRKVVEPRRIVAVVPDAAQAAHYASAVPGWSEVRLDGYPTLGALVDHLASGVTPPDGLVVAIRAGAVGSPEMWELSARRWLQDIASVALVDSDEAAAEATHLGFWATLRAQGERIGPTDCGRAFEVCRALGSGWSHRAYQSLSRVYEQLASAHQSLLRRSVDAAAGQAMIVHDLRSPLGVLRGVLMEMNEESVNPDRNDERKLRRLMDRACDQLEGLVEQLERLHTAQADQMQRSTLDLSSLAQSVVEGARRSVAAKGKRITLHDSDAAFVSADQQGFVRVLDNLIGNALRHARGEVDVRVEADADEVRLIVSDDGPGIAPELKADLFQRFVRHPTTGRLGLGLAIVLRVVERHEGTIEALDRSEIDGSPLSGAAFVVRLPRRSSLP